MITISEIRRRDSDDRSRSRSRDRKRSVSFSERRRDTTPGRRNVFISFEEELFIIKNDYDEVFLNDKHFSDKVSKSKQLMILDIGCPKSLMGLNEYKSLKSTLTQDEKQLIEEFPCNKKFKFGPSKVYEASFRVVFPLKLSDAKVITCF